MEFERFRELIEEFVCDNFIADGCKECHEICHNLVPDDHKGSYDKAIKKLKGDINGY